MFTQQDADRIGEQLSEAVGRPVSVELIEVPKSWSLAIEQMYNCLSINPKGYDRTGIKNYEIDFYGLPAERYLKLENAVNRVIELLKAQVETSAQ